MQEGACGAGGKELLTGVSYVACAASGLGGGWRGGDGGINRGL